MFSLSSRRALRLPSLTRAIANRSTGGGAQFSVKSRMMAARPADADEAISQATKQDGGSSQGSPSAQMQSQVDKTRNFEQAAQEIGGKMQANPASITTEV